MMKNFWWIEPVFWQLVIYCFFSFVAFDWLFFLPEPGGYDDRKFGRFMFAFLSLVMWIISMVAHLEARKREPKR